jgi:hypothetical protein
LDDLIVGGRTFKGHLLNLRKVFQRFREARLNLNTEKFQLFQRDVRYLGHIVSPEGISTNPKKLKAVQKWPNPQNKRATRSFMGLCTYYRRFISGFADIAKPLTKLTERKISFQWTSEGQAAFEKLHVALCAAPFLLTLSQEKVSLLTQM